MTADEFRRYGYAAVDWVARYWDRLDELPVTPGVKPGDVAAQLPPAAGPPGYGARLDELPVTPGVKPGDVAAQLPPAPPQSGEDFARILADLDGIVVPGLTHWQHPGHFAYFPANTSGPSVLADLI